MTVCIAAICENGKAIVAASDHMVTFGSFATDGTVFKTDPIHPNWFAFFAGDEVGHVRSILSQAKFMLWDMAKHVHRNPTDNEVAYIMNVAYQRRLREEIETRYLYRRQLDLERFLEDGPSKLPPKIYGELSAKINAASLGVSFLVCGFGPTGEGHIFTVDGKQAPQSRDQLGFWAIGSGAHAAVSSLAFHVEKGRIAQWASLDSTIYHVCEAKFMAESSPTVGKKTFVCVYGFDENVGYLTDPGVAFIRKEWEEKGQPRPSPINNMSRLSPFLIQFDPSIHDKEWNRMVTNAKRNAPLKKQGRQSKPPRPRR